MEGCPRVLWSEGSVAGHGLFNGERSEGASGWVVQRREFGGC